MFYGVYPAYREEGNQQIEMCPVHHIEEADEGANNLILKGCIKGCYDDIRGVLLLPHLT
jgi:hypothetical protein